MTKNIRLVKSAQSSLVTQVSIDLYGCSHHSISEAKNIKYTLYETLNLLSIKTYMDRFISKSDTIQGIVFFTGNATGSITISSFVDKGTVVADIFLTESKVDIDNLSLLIAKSFGSRKTVKTYLFRGSNENYCYDQEIGDAK